MRFAIVLFILLSSALANADTRLAGEWIGWGLWSYGDSGINCNMRLQFDENDNQVERLGGAFDCNVLALYSDPLSWNKSDGVLTLNGTPSGEYRDGYVQMREPVNDTTSAVTTIRISGDRAAYEEIWSEGDKVVYRIEGNLKRKK